jgi:hypothetical protein
MVNRKGILFITPNLSSSANIQAKANEIAIYEWNHRYLAIYNR